MKYKLMPPIKPDPVPALTERWQCVFCDEPAVLLHKGSSYCRTHYNAKAYAGELVG